MSNSSDEMESSYDYDVYFTSDEREAETESEGSAEAEAESKEPWIYSDFKAKVPPKTAGLLESWRMLYLADCTMEEVEIHCAEPLYSALAELEPFGCYLLHISVVGRAISEMLETPALHVEAKEGIVKTLLSCQAISFPHLLSSTNVTGAILSCREANPGSQLLSAAGNQIFSWANEVHDKAEGIAVDSIHQWISQIKKVSACGTGQGKARGIDCETGRLLPANPVARICAEYLKSGSCAQFKCSESHPFLKEHLWTAWKNRKQNMFGYRRLKTGLQSLGVKPLEPTVSESWMIDLRDLNSRRDAIGSQPTDPHTIKSYCDGFSLLYRDRERWEFKLLEARFTPPAAAAAAAASGSPLADALQAVPWLMSSAQEQYSTPPRHRQTTAEMLNEVQQLVEAYNSSKPKTESSQLSTQITSHSSPTSVLRSTFNTSIDTSVDEPSADGGDMITPADESASAAQTSLMPARLWTILHGPEDPEHAFMWEALFSQRALRDFRAAMKARNELVPVVKKLVDLLQGNWTPSNAKMLTSHDGGSHGCRVPVYEIQALNNVRLIWQVDCCFLPQLSVQAQCIRVWSIVKHSEINSELDRISRIHRSYTAEHCKMCRLKSCDAERRFVQPVHFPGTSGLGQSPPENAEANDKVNTPLTKVDEGEIETHERFHSVSMSMLDHLLAFNEHSTVDNTIEFPLHPSEAEYHATMQSGSVLLVGRSGTGKTSCQMARLLCHHAGPNLMTGTVTCDTAAESRRPVRRQMFITAAPELCRNVKKHFERLKKGVEELHQPRGTVAQMFEGTDEVADAINQPGAEDDGQASCAVHEEAADELPDDILDEIGDDFLQKQGEPETEEDEEDEIDKMMAAIPNNLSEVADDQWPLFLTYDKLVTMVEGTLVSHGVTSKVEDLSYLGFQDFDVMWSSFDRQLTKMFDPSLVWTEICSVIKGSGRRNSEGIFAPLTREEYLGVSQRMYPEFNQRSRALVYDLFEKYERRKRQEGLPDEMDRVIRCTNKLDKLLKTSGQDSTNSIMLHEVYCDEVQDLVQLQVKMLLQLCSNAHGLYLSGDTAQTIANGAAFRFEHTKDTFYRHATERRQMALSLPFSASHAGLDNTALATVSWAAKDPSACKPFLMHLTSNYRSHQGILSAAGVVLDLLQRFFKDSVDSLEKDNSTIPGALPLFFHETTEGALDMHLFGSGRETGDCELGADQVILVRDLETKHALESRICALVLTIYEAKGREFNDVLIYNFFSDSPLQTKQHWWALLNHCPEARPSDAVAREMSAGASGPAQQKAQPKDRTSLPEFNAEKHNRLCSEMKHLYTAVTRARKRLWFFDDNYDLREPILRVWLASASVQLATQDSPSVQRDQLASKSTPQQWAKQGRSFFLERRYSNAVSCFRISLSKEMHPKVQRWMMAAQAYACKEDAEKMRFNSRRERSDLQEKFRAAAMLFEALPSRSRRETSMAADCRQKAGQLEQAAELLFGTGHKDDMEKAAGVFLMARVPARAADVFEALGQHATAVKTLLNNRYVDEALRRVSKEAFNSATLDGLSADSTTVELSMMKQRATRVGVWHAQRLLKEQTKASHRAGQHTMRLVMEATDTYEEQVKLLKETNCTQQLLEKYLEHGDHHKASGLLESSGDYVRAAEQLRLAAEQPTNAEVQASLVTRRTSCLLTAAHLAVAPSATMEQHRQPALCIISSNLPVVDLSNRGGVEVALGLCAEVMTVPPEMPVTPAAAVLLQESQVLQAVCQGDLASALRAVKALEHSGTLTGRKAWARSLLAVLSLTLSQNQPGTTAEMFAEPETWQAAADGLLAFSSLVREVLQLSSRARHLQLNEKQRSDVRLLQALCGVAAVDTGDCTAVGTDLDTTPVLEGAEAWEKLSRCLALGLARLLQGWEALSDNHRAHKLCLRPICTGVRLFGRCFIHQSEVASEKNDTYQRRWEESVGRQATMVNLLGYGGMQWLYSSVHERHLPESIQQAVMPTLRRWTERLASCLAPRGSDLAMAPSTLASALARLPASARASVGELVTRVWLARECTTTQCVPGRVLQSAMLLLHLGRVGSLALWKPGRTASRNKSPSNGGALFPLLVDCMGMFEGRTSTKHWQRRPEAGLQFVETLLQSTGRKPDAFLFANQGGKDKAPLRSLDPLPVLELLEMLVTIASLAAKGGDQILLPEGMMSLWLAPHKTLVKQIVSPGAADSAGPQKRGTEWLNKCVHAAVMLMSQLWGPSWQQQAGRTACGPPAGGQQRQVWTQAEMALRIAVVAAVGVVNSPRRLQAQLMPLLRIMLRNENVKMLCVTTGGSFVGWHHPGAARLFQALGGNEAGLKEALVSVSSSASLGGPVLISKSPGRSPPAALSSAQHVILDPNTGTLQVRDQQLHPMAHLAVSASAGGPGAGGNNSKEVATATRDYEAPSEERLVSACHTIISWKRRVFARRAAAAAIQDPTRLAAVKSAVARWRRTGEPQTVRVWCDVNGMMYLGLVAPHHLMKHLYVRRRSLQNQAGAENDGIDEEQYQEWEDIVQRQLPAVEEAIDSLRHHLSEARITTGDQTQGIASLARDCLLVLQLLGDEYEEDEYEDALLSIEGVLSGEHANNQVAEEQA